MVSNLNCFNSCKRKKNDRPSSYHPPSVISLPSVISIRSEEDSIICPPESLNSDEKIPKKKPLALHLLKKKLKKQSGPPWYRELSPSQMKSADGLQNSLRDDLEQHSTTKTRKLISHMGLTSLPNNKNLALSMDMSRGNDLAFLWFLNETNYNTQSLQDDRTDYNENEKIILSSIAHLDMITTLRELDRILPKPPAVTEPHKALKKHTKKIIYRSPYLEPLIRPKIPMSRVYLPPKKPNIPITPYEVYKDRTYTPPNEENRWYATKTRKPADIDREAVLKKVWSGSATDFEKRKEQIFDQFLELTKCQKNERTHIVYQIDLNNASTTEEFEELARQYQNQMIVKTIVRDLMENALNVQKLRACCKTLECMMDYEKYLCVLEKNMKQQKLEREDPKYFDITECKFDYEKIFNDETFEQKQMESGYLAGEIDRRMGGKCTEVCMKNLFGLEIPLWTEAMPEDTENYTDEDFEGNEDEAQSVHSSKSGPTVDPNDPEEIQNELQRALNKMKKNPKFVLASIPLASKIPILAEFAFQRFGRTFTDRERLKLFKKVDKQCEVMKKAKIKLKAPKADAISTRKNPITWDQRAWLMHRTNEVRDEFYHRVKLYFLEQTRLFWPVLLPYLCTDGLPREVFYTYLPSKENDVYPFRPWSILDDKKDTNK